MSNIPSIPLSAAYVLLGLIRHEPLHGYEIHRRLAETPELRLVWHIKQSRLYALLSRLEDEGLAGVKVEPQEARPPRKVYHLTATGRHAYEQWLTQPVDLPRELRLDFMLKLYFAIEEGPETLSLLIQRQQEICAHWLATWGGGNASTPGGGDAPVSPFIHAVRCYRHSHIEAIQEWLTSLSDDRVPVDEGVL